jgi:NitT/TauT family transport system substrate-binding protein
MRAVLVALVLFSTLAAGLRPASALDTVTLRLHWFLNGFSTAWWLGIERGYFAKEGIDLKINEGKGSVVAAQLVAAKTDQFGTVDASSLIQTAAKGAPITSIMTLQSYSPFGVVTLEESGIKSIGDLQGKRVGLTAADATTQLWPAVVSANKLDESKIKLTYMDAQAKQVALMEKRVDAILDNVPDKRAVLESKGFKPAWIRFSDVGVRMVSIALVTQNDLMKDNPDLVRRFARAAEKTWKAFLEDPEAAVAAASKAKPDADQAILRAQAIATKQEITSGLKARAFGVNDADDWKNTVSLLKELKLLDSDRPPESYYSNTFVPKS